MVMLYLLGADLKTMQAGVQWLFKKARDIVPIDSSKPLAGESSMQFYADSGQEDSQASGEMADGPSPSASAASSSESGPDPTGEDELSSSVTFNSATQAGFTTSIRNVQSSFQRFMSSREASGASPPRSWLAEGKGNTDGFLVPPLFNLCSKDLRTLLDKMASQVCGCIFLFLFISLFE